MNNKIFNIRKIAVILGIAALFTGCKKFSEFGDTNVNPNGTGSPVFSALLTNVEAQIGGFAANTQGGLYAQYFSETQYTDVSLYALPQLNFAATYSGPLEDLQNIITNGSSKNMAAVSRILKAYILWTITDKWGPIPYSTALQGYPSPAITYDKQVDIYKGLIKECKDAVAQLDPGSGIAGDIIYGGNASNWKKLGNSLRMLMALRLTKRFPNPTDYAATEFVAAMNDVGGYIITNSDNMVINYPGGNFKNPWFNVYDGRKDYAESKTFTDILSAMGDGRSAAYGGKADAGLTSSTLGFPYGLQRNDALIFEPANSTNWARILKASYRTETSPLVVISAAEVQLAKAEAAERGWLPGLTTVDAQAFYNDGIDKSFAQWGIGASGAAVYGTGNAGNYLTGTGAGSTVIGQNSFNSIPATANATTDTKLKRIWLQQYIAAYPDGLQGWSNWRRTGFPNIAPTTFATNTSKQIPRRYTYGATEYAINAAGVASGLPDLSAGDTQDSRIWWDQ